MGSIRSDALIEQQHERLLPRARGGSPAARAQKRHCEALHAVYVARCTKFALLRSARAASGLHEACGPGKVPPMRSVAVLLRPLLVLVFAACGPSMAERTAVKMRFLPSQIETTWKFQGDPRNAKVRAHAEEAVRALPRWKEDIADQIDYCTQLLQPLVGLRLTIESYKDWARTGTPEDALRELVQLDKAKDVMWVIGYVAPPDAASTVMSVLGDAQPLGHHVTVRAWPEKSEIMALVGKLPDAKDPDRPEVINAHRRHKEAVVLIHMLATTMGAITETDPTWIQAASYSPQQTTFSNRNREVLQIAANSRVSEDTDAEMARKLSEEIERSDWGGWVPAAHDAMVSERSI